VVAEVDALRMKREQPAVTLAPRQDTARAVRSAVQGRREAESSTPIRNQEVERLYDRYKDHVFRIAMRYGRGDASWAEDVAHDVFIDVFKVMDRLSDHGDLGAWFYRTTTNRCLNKLKRERFLSSPVVRFLLGRRGGEPPDPEGAAIARSDLAAAFRAVNTLPPKERVAFFMHYVDGQEHREIGRVLGHSKGYVSKLLERARQRLERAGWQVSDE
jgi:RNA polymerase sigma-70 factor (ECF subfamily)